MNLHPSRPFPNSRGKDHARPAANFARQLIWGPLSFWAALCIARDSSLRHPVQMMVCMGHLYGVVLYYATSTAEHHFRGVAHCRPEALYLWVYYIGFNLPWVVVPSSESSPLLF